MWAHARDSYSLEKNELHVPSIRWKIVNKHTKNKYVKGAKRTKDKKIMPAEYVNGN